MKARAVAIAPRIDRALRDRLGELGVLSQDLEDLTAGL